MQAERSAYGFLLGRWYNKIHWEVMGTQEASCGDVILL
jgi:hypothetical protein